MTFPILWKTPIQDPMAEILKGYPPAMPPNPMSDNELKLVLDYIKSLK